VELNLPPDLQERLARVAGRRGVSVDVVIREAIQRAVDDDWFIREVERGEPRPTPVNDSRATPSVTA
jgi:hypothetical protein